MYSIRRPRWSQIVLHLALLSGLVISVFPFYWLVVIATNTTHTVFQFPPRLTFGTSLVTNVAHVLQNIDFFGAFLNTLVVATAHTTLVLFFCSLAGFTFAKFSFPGKNALFVALLATLMVPAQLSTVPSFVIMAHLGWVGTFKPLIIPGAVSAFGIFWVRQYAQDAIHSDVIDAAHIDGAGHFSTYWHIALPFLRPALASLGLFTFISSWNEYMWPLIILTDPHKYTLQVALSQLNGIYSSDYSMVMAGTLLTTLPLILLFLFTSKQFIANIAAGAIKD